MDTMSYLLGKNASSGGGGSSTNVYEINYDMQTGKYSGTIPTNLTVEDLINTNFKANIDFVNKQTQETIHLTYLGRVLKCLGQDGVGPYDISIVAPNDFDIDTLGYTPSTGAISSR